VELVEVLMGWQPVVAVEEINNVNSQYQSRIKTAELI